MKKLMKTFVLAVAVLSLAFTGALAAGPVKDAGKHDKKSANTEKAPKSAEQKARKPRDPSQRPWSPQLFR